MLDRLRRAFPALVGLALFAAALFVLRRELHTITWHELTADLGRTPASRLALALLLTALNKEKFHPQWEPRYLVYPGGFRLPRILADVSALVAGGYLKIVLKR